MATRTEKHIFQSNFHSFEKAKYAYNECCKIQIGTPAEIGKKSGGACMTTSIFSRRRSLEKIGSSLSSLIQNRRDNVKE